MSPNESPRAQRSSGPTRPVPARSSRAVALARRSVRRAHGWFERQPRGRRWATVVLLAAVLAGAALIGWGSSSGPDATTVPLSQAVSEIKSGDIAAAKVDDTTARVVLTRTQDAGGSRIQARFPLGYSDTLTDDLIAAGVRTQAASLETSVWESPLLLTLVPVALIIGFLLYVAKSGGLTGGIGKFSGRRGREISEVPSTRFEDVAGAEEALTEMQELVEFLRDGERFTRVGAKPPRGALLVGPPGTGKTLLARAVAGEAGVPFFALAGSDFVETFAGVGAKRVRDLFDAARAAGSAIVFIDEIDAIGRARGSGSVSGADSERENTLIAMLDQMDGFDTAHRIIVLAATNRADVLDPALTRPGRLDRQIQVPAPDRLGRTAILRVHTRGRPVSDDVDLVTIARRTPGMSGAELAQVVNEACMEAARRSTDLVDADCFDSAIATVALGRARTSALVTDFDREVTAWHEAGHTLAALLLPDADDPVQVSIIPRGPAGGVTWMSGNDDIFLTRARALADLRVSLAGRAAEEILLDGEYTQGAHGDLDAATRRAMAMVTKYGMSRLGYVLVDDETVRMGGPVALQVREVAEELLSEAHTDAYALLSEHHELLRRVAVELLDKENLSLRELRTIVDDAAATAFIPRQADPGSPVRT
ncbi:ATP-dependent metallopeptidase FtsH/Yme1/Tma family protein [Angustibacter sp. Root456]|uniref:ATP-dependent metallopeptidase FtsH/Yme1/Tma family protein n=1 Tax=Angustibacter sp. Root456 TaxID=1736539 RepID=UPI0009EAC33A|nr:AAA family ATPase [Angustibacter sp. Root456]